MKTKLSRAAAIKAGAKTYFTGKPCKRGHVSERYAANGTCIECFNARQRAAYHANPEPARAAKKRRYWADPEAARQATRTWTAENKDAVAAYKKAKHAANPEIATERARQWQKANPERLRTRLRAKWQAMPAEEKAKNFDKLRQHRLDNPERYRALSAAHQARRRAATPSWVDLDAIKAVYLACPPGLHVDHIVPLNGRTVCGLHVPWNLQYLTKSENSRKSNRLIAEIAVASRKAA